MNGTARVSKMVSVATAVALSGAVLAGCGEPREEARAPQAPQATEAAPSEGSAAPAAAATGPLSGTRWRLLEIQSMDDAIGSVQPADPSRFTMLLKRDGTVEMNLDCNRAHGSWSADGGPESASGHFEFGPLAATRALCPPPNLDERVLAQAGYVRSFLLKDGRLYLSLMADGGILAWEPDTDE